MKSLAYTLLASALPAIRAQSTSDEAGVRVWAAVAFINHGDKTPYYSSSDEVLVPEGAQQLWRQGAAFRARYLNKTSEGTSSSITAAPIQGISAESLENVQVDVTSGDEQWIVAGALAFMQALYPPVTGSVTNDMARNLASNGSDLIEFPLDGYQYPLVQALSSLDKNSPGIQGTVGCSEWSNQTQTVLRETDDMKTYFEDTLGFYQDLVSSSILGGAGSIMQSDANFWNAYEIYEWARYMYAHNETVFDGLDNANKTLTELGANALALARAKLTTPDTASGSNEAATIITTVAGRSLARKILDQLKTNIRWAGSHDKLSIMFGSYEPLLSFLSFAGLLTRENLASGPFSRFPDHGAALVIELISTDDQTSDVMPAEENLNVRLYYRENTDEDTAFEGFSMLGSGMSGQSIPYTSFARKVNEQGLSSDEWCGVCNSQQAPFCPTSMNLYDVCRTINTGDDDDGNQYGLNAKNMHPAIAGIIGAIIFGTVGGIITSILYHCGGFRFIRVAPEERTSAIAGFRGGFKGQEKKPDDADMEVTKAGAQQERIGSWELKGPDDDGAVQGASGAGLAVKQPSQAKTREFDSHWKEDDEVSLVGASPVAVRESV